MQYLSEQIYDQAGITTSDNFGITDIMLNDIATQAVRIIVNRVKAYNPDKLSFFSYSTALTDGNGKALTDLTSNIILDCERARGDFKYPCEYMPWQLAEKAKNVHTVDYRTKYDPIWTEKDAKVYIIPDPSASESGYIHHVKFADIVTTTVETINDTADTTFPIELDQAVIKWVVMQIKLRMLNKLLVLAQEEFSDITGDATTASEAFTSQTTVVFTHNIGRMPGIVVVNANRKEIQCVIVHSADFLSTTLYFSIAQSGTVYATATTETGGDLASFSSALPTWTSPDVPSLPNLIVDRKIETMVKALPAYAAIDFTGITVPSLSSELATSVPTISAFTATLANLDSTRIVHALNSASGWIYKQNSDGTTEGVAIDTHAKVTSHDVALANEATKAANAYTQTAAQEIALETAKMQSVSEDIKHIIGEFNGNISAYQTRIQGAIAEYQAEVAHYNADITKILGEYQAENKLQVDLFSAELQERIQQYQAETAVAINVYQAEVQAILGEYNALVNEMVQEFQSGIARATSYLQSANIRLQVGRALTEQAGVLPNEIIKLDAQFENEVRLFCGVQQQPQQQDDRR